MGLVAVAALFSAGVWWGMQVHGKTVPASKRWRQRNSETAPQPVTRSVSSAPAA